MRRLRLLLTVLLVGPSLPVCGQQGRDGGTIAIVIGAEPKVPVPTFNSNKADLDVGSLLFLPLARLNKALEITKREFTPPAIDETKRSWRQRSPRTPAL